jgi:hypothetical protein
MAKRNFRIDSPDLCRFQFFILTAQSEERLNSEGSRRRRGYGGQERLKVESRIQNSGVRRWKMED